MKARQRNKKRAQRLKPISVPVDMASKLKAKVFSTPEAETVEDFCDPFLSHSPA